MYHGFDVRPHLVNLAVDKTFGKNLAPFGIDWIAVEVVLDDVAGSDEFRRDRARHQVMLGIARVAGADVSSDIDHALVDQNTARCDKVVYECRTDRPG